MLKLWLSREYVARFHEYPKRWLCEICRCRHDSGFITSFIAELDGTPFAYCMYYDCFVGQKYGDEIMADTPGTVFSIDELIGEPAFLNHGYGTAMCGMLVEKVRGIPTAKEIYAGTEPDNIAAQKTLTANGFFKDGEYYKILL